MTNLFRTKSPLDISAYNAQFKVIMRTFFMVFHLKNFYIQHYKFVKEIYNLSARNL